MGRTLDGGPRRRFTARFPTPPRPMPRPALLLAACLAVAGCAASRPSVVVAPADGDPTALVPWRGGLAVAAGSEVRLVRGGAVVGAVALPAAVFDLAGRDTLWAATAAGLFSIADPDAAPVPAPLPAGGAVRVLAVAEGPDGRLWAGTARDGAFVREGGAWRQVTGAAPVGGVAAQDGAVWLATHQGVSRRGADGADARFTEEGTTEHGLLDNVVDRLWATADGAVWAVHPEGGVSVFTDGEPHGFAFVGRRGAALLDAVALPGGGYALATTAGVLGVAALSDNPEGFYEVYADSGTAAAPLAAARAPAALGGAAPTRLAVADGALWLASRAGLWSVPLDALRPALAAR